MSCSCQGCWEHLCKELYSFGDSDSSVGVGFSFQHLLPTHPPGPRYPPMTRNWGWKEKPVCHCHCPQLLPVAHRWSGAEAALGVPLHPAHSGVVDRWWWVHTTAPRLDPHPPDICILLCLLSPISHITLYAKDSTSHLWIHPLQMQETGLSVVFPSSPMITKQTM